MDMEPTNLSIMYMLYCNFVSLGYTYILLNSLLHITIQISRHISNNQNNLLQTIYYSTIRPLDILHFEFFYYLHLSPRSGSSGQSLLTPQHTTAHERSSHLSGQERLSLCFVHRHPKAHSDWKLGPPKPRDRKVVISRSTGHSGERQALPGMCTYSYSQVKKVG